MKKIIILFTYIIITSPIIWAQDNQKIIAKVLPSIVIIDSERIVYSSPYDSANYNDLFYPFNFETPKGTPQGNGIEHKNIFGSGTILKKEKNTYYVLTNNHVVENSSSLWITTHDGYIHRAALLGSDEERDIALISFESVKSYPLIKIGNYNSLREGSAVFAIGVPFGFTYTVSKGIVSSLDKTDSTLKNLFIQTDASMNPGNSGGALVNAEGELVGVSTWIYSPKGSSSIGINFASSINTAVRVVDNILAGKKDDHAWVGLSYDAFSPVTLYKMNINYRLGSIITNIVRDSPADKASLLIGDMILSVNGVKVKSFNSNLTNTTALISTLDSGNEIEIEVRRNNENIAINVTPTVEPDFDNRDTLLAISENIWPGMSVIPLEDYKQELLGLSTESFIVYVDSIIPNTPAEKSDINKEDIIVKINGKNMRSYQDYLDAINAHKQNKRRLVFTVFKNGDYIEKPLNQ